MRWIPIAALGLVLGATAAMIVPRLLRDDAPAPARSRSPSPSPLAPSVPAPTPPNPATVVIQLDTRPSGAEIFVGGARRGTTPARLVLERSTVPVPIVLRRGTAELRHELDASRDGSLELALPASSRLAPGPTPGRSQPPPVPAATRDAAVPTASPAITPDAAVPAAPPPDAATPRSGLGDNLLPPRDRR